MNIRQLVKNTSLGENSSYRTPQVRHGRGIKEFMGIPVDRDHPFRFIVTGDSGGS